MCSREGLWVLWIVLAVAGHLLLQLGGRMAGALVDLVVVAAAWTAPGVFLANTLGGG